MLLEILTGITFAYVALSSIPACVTLFQWLRRSEKADLDFYEDEDGVASNETAKVYTVKPQKCLICFAAFVGSVVGLSTPVGVSRDIPEQCPMSCLWSLFCIWVSCNVLFNFSSLQAIDPPLE